MIHTLWHLPLYYDSSFASVPNTVHFLISVVCYNTLYTVVFLNTRFSVLMTILMHWSMNLTPYALERVFPSVPDNPVSSWMEVAALVIVTAIVVRLAAPQLLARPHDPERDLLLAP